MEKMMNLFLVMRRGLGSNTYYSGLRSIYTQQLYNAGRLKFVLM